METNNEKHAQIIKEQFSQQAIPFTKIPGHLDSIQMLVEMSQVSAADHVLDVACGPGSVSCEFAKIAKHVTGIDITEAMIAQAKRQQDEHGLSNLSWDIATVTPLPYASNSFSLVMTRYSFHHFLDPQAMMQEMYRVCKPGGIILIADVALPKENIAAYNQMEKLRDPSHTQALSFDDFEQLFSQSGLKNIQQGRYSVAMELEKQLQASFPNSGDDEKIRTIFREDLKFNRLGVGTKAIADEIHFSYPISIYMGRK